VEGLVFVDITVECPGSGSAYPEHFVLKDYSLGVLDVVPYVHEGISKSFRTESITKYTLTTINTR
jgi:hypothetical protein